MASAANRGVVRLKFAPASAKSYIGAGQSQWGYPYRNGDMVLLGVAASRRTSTTMWKVPWSSQDASVPGSGQETASLQLSVLTSSSRIASQRWSTLASLQSHLGYQ